MAVQGTVDYQNVIRLRRIAAPGLIFLKEPAKILSPDGAVQRKNFLNLKPCCLFQNRLYLRAVLADDVCIIAAGVIKVMSLEIILIRENSTLQCSEGSESICGEQSLVGIIICQQNLRPVYHGSGNEMEGMSTGAKGVPLLDDLLVFDLQLREELGDELEGLHAGHNGGFRILIQYRLQQRAVIRLHVQNHKIVRLLLSENRMKIFQILICNADIRSVEERDLLIDSGRGFGYGKNSSV